MVLNMTLLLTNIVQNANTANTDESCIFAESDPYGVIMAIIGMGIVFMALLLLFVVFTNTPVLFTPGFKEKVKLIFKFRKQEPAVLQTEEEEKEKAKEEELSGEVNAAIATAIHLYRSELHDYEDTVLTIKKVSRTYSPWSSKIYGLRNNLNVN